MAPPVTPRQQESLAGRRRHGGAGPRLLAAFRLGVVVRRSQPADGLLPADAGLDPWGTKRGVAAAAVGAVRDRIGPAVVCGGAKIHASWSGAGVGGAAGLQSGARVLLAGSPQLYPGHSAGAAVLLLLRAGGGRGPAARLGAVDGRQPACVLQSRFRRASAGGAGVLLVFPQGVFPPERAGDLETSDFLRAADSGGGHSGADIRVSRLAREPALHLDAACKPEGTMAPWHVFRREWLQDLSRFDFVDRRLCRDRAHSRA